MNLPKDPVILLSYVNTQLRDFYPSLDSFCEENELEKSKITDLLSSIDYEYDAGRNQFI
ncbi:MAG: DUF4250 domain-containing protein [Lachnospiraceae bacterium]|nr:DUF4250 domain-containing protein [Candidatus Fimimorpha excrementavium]